MIKKIFFFLLISLSILAIVLLWPQKEKLPHLGKIENASLDSLDGKTYKLDDKKVKLVMFFYTNCPDICPMTMFDMKEIKQKLSAKGLYGDKVRFLSITLDPETDTPEKLQDYAGNFGVDHEGWLMLRTDYAATEKIAKDFNMAYKKNESGFVTHSTTMYLVDEENNIRAYHDMSVGDQKVNIEQVVQHIEWLATEGE